MSMEESSGWDEAQSLYVLSRETREYKVRNRLHSTFFFFVYCTMRLVFLREVGAAYNGRSCRYRL